MNLNNSPAFGALTEADLDAARCCGACQQGRLPCAMPAECCTEVGADDATDIDWIDAVWVGCTALVCLAVLSALVGYIVARIN